MYTLLYGMFPFSKDLSSDLNKEVEFHSMHPESISPEAVDLIRIMLNKDPNQRPSAQEALNHPFFQLHPNDAPQENDEIGQIFNAIDQ